MTWIASVGISILGSAYRGENATKIRFEAAQQQIFIGNNAVLSARKVEKLTFSKGKLRVLNVVHPKSRKEVSVAVELEDVGMSFTASFKKFHLDIGWGKVSLQGRDSHGILGRR